MEIFGSKIPNEEIKKQRGKTISTDHTEIAQMNADFRKKCETQNLQDMQAYAQAANEFATK